MDIGYVQAVCSNCKWFQGHRHAIGEVALDGTLELVDTDDFKPFCVAYPDGIPEELRYDISHVNPHPGDNGLQYVPATVEDIEARRDL